jgi:hypothetical protein
MMYSISKITPHTVIPSASPVAKPEYESGGAHPPSSFFFLHLFFLTFFFFLFFTCGQKLLEGLNRSLMEFPMVGAA